ncbi:hypothetical protein HMPREF9374_1134 [Desmospora sp. 8437]|nr:hypothetical protein HMPREF9374_1134 [Desmospora sp. 8437]
MERWYRMKVHFADGAIYETTVEEAIKQGFNLSRYETVNDWITLHERNHGVIINSDRVNYITFDLIPNDEVNTAAKTQEQVG